MDGVMGLDGSEDVAARPRKFCYIAVVLRFSVGTQYGQISQSFDALGSRLLWRTSICTYGGCSDG